MSSGYKGFKSWAAQECPSLKPGESYDARATKFSQMGSNIVHNQPPNTSVRVINPAFESLTKNNYGNVTKQDYIPHPMRPTSREEVANSRAFLGQSLYQTDFLHFQEEGKRIGEIPMATYEAAFDEYAEVPNQEDGSKKLAHQFVKSVLRSVYGKSPTTRVLEIYTHMFDAVPEGYISWEIFQEAVLRLNSFLQNQTIKSPSAWLEFLASKNVLPGGTPSSSHQIDYGTYGSEPIARPYIARNHGMASTTTDLFDGTTKSSFHIPRYQGFIPQTKYNPIATTQGNCEHPRPTSEDLRLYHLNNIPGYTGHKPVDSKNVRGEAKTGSDPRTTNGYVYSPHL